MPIIAVGAAIYAGATIATVGVAAMSTMAVISAVGAIASGIGVVTGNKELTRIGGIVGLVGGVGALAQSQGWIGAEIAKGGADGAALASGADGASAATAAQSAAPGVIDPSAAVAQNVSQAGATAVDAASAGAAAGAAPASGLINSATDAVSSAATALQSGGSSVMSTLKSVTEWADKNKNVASLLTSFVGGALDPEADAKAKQADAAADLYKARAENELLQGGILKQQTANANSVPDLTGLKVDPNKNIYSKTKAPVYNGPKAAGLINA